jgi:hypothetical protein
VPLTRKNLLARDKHTKKRKKGRERKIERRIFLLEKTPEQRRRDFAFCVRFSTPQTREEK